MKGGTPSITEFPDSLSPLLVRQLRRLLRSRSLVASFVVLQVLAIAATLLAFLPRRELDFGIGFFSLEVDLLTLFAVFFFTFLLPFQHFHELQSELGPGRNLELLEISRVGPRRLVLHLYLGGMALVVILLFSILPHYLIGYLLGRYEPPEVAENLAGLLLAASVMTGIVIGASAITTVAGRIGVILALFLAHEWITWLFYASSGGFVRLSGPLVFVSEVLLAVIFTFLGLQIGSSRIAASRGRSLILGLGSLIGITAIGCAVMTVLVPVAGVRDTLPVLVLFVVLLILHSPLRVAKRSRRL